MWVDYRGSLSTVYNDGEISTCGWIIEVHSVRSFYIRISTCTLQAALYVRMYISIPTYVEYMRSYAQ